MAQILLQAAALISEDEVVPVKEKPASARKRTRKSSSKAAQPKAKKGRRAVEPKSEGRAVELGAWLRSL